MGEASQGNPGREALSLVVSARTQLDEETVTRQSANMHMIPTTPEMRRKFSTLRKGDVVQISGFLVDISNEEGFSWLTSRVRTDSGRGACEVILIESVKILGR